MFYGNMILIKMYSFIQNLGLLPLFQMSLKLIPLSEAFKVIH